MAAEVEERLREPLYSVILDSSSTAPPFDRIHEGIRHNLRELPDEARIMGVIEQVSRFDDELRNSRNERHRVSSAQIADSIRRLQRHGLADERLDPVIAAAGLGAMTYRFPEMWFVQGLLDCEFEEGVEQLTRLFVNALGLSDSPAASRRAVLPRAPARPRPPDELGEELPTARPSTAVHRGEGRVVMARPLGPTKVSSSLALPVIVHSLQCTK